MISPPFNAGQPIVNKDGTMSDAFRTLLINQTLSNFIFGVGSPEGVVEARQWQLYVDRTGTTGSLLYLKQFPEILGDPKAGWVAV